MKKHIKDIISWTIIYACGAITGGALVNDFRNRDIQNFSIIFEEELFKEGEHVPESDRFTVLEASKQAFRNAWERHHTSK